VNVLHFASYKSRRVTRSVLGGEVHAFADAFDIAYALKHELERLINHRIPLSILTDSKGLFDVVTRNSHARERLLNIEIAATRQAYRLEDISDIGLIWSEDNPADAFTKRGQCNALRRLMTSGLTSIPVVQAVLRNEMTSIAMDMSNIKEEEGGV
jgi:hypothetical protein